MFKPCSYLLTKIRISYPHMLLTYYERNTGLPFMTTYTLKVFPSNDILIKELTNKTKCLYCNNPKLCVMK